jgi:hypothetical protein
LEGGFWTFDNKLKSQNSVAVLVIYKGNVILVKHYRPALEKGIIIEFSEGITKRGDTEKGNRKRTQRGNRVFSREYFVCVELFSYPCSGNGVGITHLFTATF